MENEFPSTLELKNIPNLRVSCASFSKIVDEHGKLALLLNIKNPKPVLTPIGGGIHLTTMGKLELMANLGINQFQDGMDMRFQMHGKYSEELRRFFLQRRGRELTPKRELIRELTEEYLLLKNTDFEETQFRNPLYFSEVGPSFRPGHEKELTLRLIEVFDTSLVESVLKKLVVASNTPQSPLKFVTEYMRS